MTSQNFRQANPRFPRHCRDHKNSRIALGTFVVLIGAILLLSRIGFFIFPFHVWPFILIAIGIYSGIKHNFSHMGSWVLIVLGILFAIPRFAVFGVMSTHLVAPLLLIVFGIFLILKPRRRYFRDYTKDFVTTDENSINLDVSFGERTSVVTSKNFKGGFVGNTFGETKLNLLQADSQEPMVLDLKVSFGAVEIIVPSHWEVEFQVSNSFASVEDKRYMRVVQSDEKKLLIVRGNCSFGSISVKTV